MRQFPALNGFRAFLTVCFGQTVSLVGSGLSSFALSLWVLQSSGSVTTFAMVMLCVTLPGAVISPIAGAIADRWDRKKVMLLSDLCNGLSTVALAALFMTGHISIWHIYVANAINSICTAFQFPAYMASITMLVPKENLSRANGLLKLSQSAAELLTPALAGLLVVTIKIQGVILIDLLTFLCAVTAMLFVRIPKPPQSAEGHSSKGTFLREVALGWTYIANRSGLLGLHFFNASISFLINLADVLMYPLILTLASSQVVGALASLNGGAMLVGSLLMSTWGGPKSKVVGVLTTSALMGIGIIVAGLKPNLVLIATGMVCWFFFYPMMGSMSQSIWHAKVAPDVQGRVFAMRRMFQLLMTSLSFLVAGPLADRVFTPMLMEGGSLAGVLGPVIGAGEGRGYALLYIVTGTVIVLGSVAAYLYPRIRRVQEELPDSIPEPQAASKVNPEAAAG